MAEPLSFVASVIAVSTLAGVVVSKGYRYIKAVKDCPEEVNRLIVEVNVLCGILERLVVLLRGNKSVPPEAASNERKSLRIEDGQHDDIDVSSSSDDDSGSAAEILDCPVFVYECQKTLSEVETILNKFARKNAHSPQNPNTPSKLRFSKLRRLSQKDLKWPLARSMTMQLVQALERNKATCTLALASTGLVGVHAVFEQTQLSNKHLAALRATQEKMLELSISREEEKALAWLSTVSPASRLQDLKRERQRDTGAWLFDLPEMVEWLENSDAALWIYGIPGAGKTILSTMVVDEVLNRKRSESIGTAYFYVRYDNIDTHKTKNVLGSLVVQLARQSPRALANVVRLYAQHNDPGSLATTPEDHELLEQLFDISRDFTDTYIMIDGLDECGQTFDRDRKRLIDAVAQIRGHSQRSIRTLIFSRDELDIRQRLSEMRYRIVSIAATSADLRLFTNAWIPSLGVQSEKLKTEIVDTLVSQAKGMFMWVRAQIDYLQRLPNDLAKRRALEKLPPDLKTTYIRIFETIDSNFEPQTIRYIQRLLRWLVLQKGEHISAYRSYLSPELTAEALCQAICIEGESHWPTIETTPSIDHVIRWLGCLIRVDRRSNVVHLSHFTVKEFLTMRENTVLNPVAQKFMVNAKDERYIVDVCLSYIMHSHFENTVISVCDDVDDFISKYPLWKYIAIALPDHLWFMGGAGAEDDYRLAKFLALPSCRGFELWDICNVWLDAFSQADMDGELGTDIIRRLPSTLHLASVAGLPNSMREMLGKGADPNGSYITPLHLAICVPLDSGITMIEKSLHILYENPSRCEPSHNALQRSLETVEVLVNAGADIDQQLTIDLVMSPMEDYVPTRVTPLIMAVLCNNWRVVSFLLDAGAEWATIANIELDDIVDLCSIMNLLKKDPGCESIIRRAVELSAHDGLRKALAEDDMQVSLKSTNPLAAFVNAFGNQQWSAHQSRISLKKAMVTEPCGAHVLKN